MKNSISKILFFLTLSSFSFVHSEMIILGSPTCQFSHIDSNSLKYIFLSKIKSVNNQKVVPLHSDNYDEEKEFNKVVIRKKELSLKHYWVKMTFTNKGRKPKQINNEIFLNKDICYITYKVKPFDNHNWKKIVLTYD
jgi:hypothetical protein